MTSTPQLHVRGRPLPRLTSLRAVAALFVFGFHLVRWDVLDLPPLALGLTGVSFFFVLSGFVLSWSTAPARRPGVFWWHRFARIYPLHLFALVAAFALPVRPHEMSAESVIANLLLLQAWWLDEQVVFGVNGVSWSLSCEVAFYALLPAALLLTARLSPGRQVAAALAWFALVSAAAAALTLLVDDGYTVALVNPVLRSGEFLLGLAASSVVRSGWRCRRRTAVGCLAGLGLLALLPLPARVTQVSLALAFVVVVVVAALADLDGAPGPLTRRAAVYAGELSFAFYLAHELVIVNVKAADGLGPLQVTGLSLAVTVAVAVVAHHLVERPARRFLLRSR